MTELVQAIRGGLIQQDRLLKADIPALPANSLVPRRVVTSSVLGRDFSVTLDMVSTAGDIALKTLIAQPMTLWIRQADRSYLPINGYIHTARRLGADGSLTTYQLSFASWLHFLRFRSDMRLWQDRSVDQIVTDIFNAHPQANGHFQFALSRALPSRSYCRQSESDWHFVHRLLESEGLFGFWRQAQDGKSHSYVITDNLFALDAMAPEVVPFSRSGASGEADAFTQWSGSRTLRSVAHATRTFDYKDPSTPSNPKGTSLPTRGDQGALPDQLEVYTYTGAYTYADQDRGDHLSKIQLEIWESEAKRFHGAGGVYGIEAGRRFTLRGHPEHDRDAAEQNAFVALKVWRYIENNLPLSDHEADFPHSLKARIADARAMQAGTGAVAHADGSEGFFLAEVEAQRVGVPYRSPLEHAKPEMHLETAIVVGPRGEEVYTDALNRIKVQFVWDRLNPGDERASCWVRVAHADSGDGYGSVHVPRIGEEVIVGHVGGDCDRPIVLHRVYNGAVTPQWNSNGILSGHRSKEYAGSGFNQLVMDDATGQNRVQLMSSSANSLLHLGYLIDQNGNARGRYLGSGFDLRTDAYGAVRASQGLYVTTYPKNATSQPLDAGEARQQLDSARAVVDALSNVSEQHRAANLKDAYDTLGAFSDATRNPIAGAAGGGRTAGGGTGEANAFQEPVMLFGSPSGIGLSTQQSVHLAADAQINIVSGQSTHVATGKSLLASVGEQLSLFVQNAGMKLFAAKGKVQIQAQSDNLELTAQKTVKVLSATERIEVAADQGILLTSGGAYIRIAGGDILIHAPGKIDIKGATHAHDGPTSTGYPLPAARPDQPGQLELKHQYANGEPLKGASFSVLDANGAVLRKGALDDTGHTIVSGLPAGMAQVQFGEDPRNQYDRASVFKTAPWPAQPGAGGDVAGTALSRLGGLLPGGAGQLAGVATQAAQGGLGQALGGQAMGLAQGALKQALPGGAGQLAGVATQAAQGGLGQALGRQAMGLAQGALKQALPGGAGSALAPAGQLRAAATQLGGLAQAARGAVPLLSL
jgi:type VI secretion system secreted protein VgrG